MEWFIVSLLFVACLLLLANFLLSMTAFNQAKQLEQSFYRFVTPVDDKTPSDLARTVDQMAALLAPRIAQSIVASFSGTASGVVRSIKAAEGEIVQEQLKASDNPLAAIAAGVFQKQLKKNPMLGFGLTQLLNKVNLGGSVAAGTPASASNNQQSQFKFGL